MTLPPFERTVAEHGPAVMRVCRALLPPADADDAWSETFLSALRAYPRLRPHSDVRAWLVTIAHRRAIDRIRSNGRAPAPTPEVPERPARAAPDDGRDEVLLDAVRALPTRQRLAVTYHHLGGLPYAEVASLTDSSETAVRRAAADGIAALRRRWMEDPR